MRHSPTTNIRKKEEKQFPLNQPLEHYSFSYNPPIFLYPAKFLCLPLKVLSQLKNLYLEIQCLLSVQFPIFRNAVIKIISLMFTLYYK